MLETLGEHLDVGHTQLLKYLEHTAHDVDALVTSTILREKVAQLTQENEQLSKQHKYVLRFSHLYIFNKTPKAGLV